MVKTGVPVLPRARVILLVDDDVQFLPLGQELLEYLGFRVLTASHGDQALELFRTWHQEIDLVIIDLNLPRRDGCQVVGELQAQAPSVKIIVTSGFFGPEEMARLQAAGVAGMIHKPFRAQQLQEEIAKVLAA